MEKDAAGKDDIVFAAAEFNHRSAGGREIKVCVVGLPAVAGDAGGTASLTDTYGTYRKKCAALREAVLGFVPASARMAPAMAAGVAAQAAG
jgi:hypothetical protein